MSRITLGLLAAGWVFALSFYIGLLRMNYPSAKKFPVLGVDVSHHQGAIHWSQARESGVQFAYLKATEGGDFRDPRFIDYRIGCKYAGVPWGAYHFFSFCRPGIDQARNFLETVPQGEPTLPPALDLEFGGNCGRELSRPEMAKAISGFTSAISGRFPGLPVFYATPEFYKRYLEGHRSEFPPHRLWIRDTVREPSQKPCDEWALWQFASRGRIPGIRGAVDLNVFCGSVEQFFDFMKSSDSSHLTT